MASNHLERRGMTPPAIYNQQVFVVCGPPPKGKHKLLAMPKLLRKYWLFSTIVAAFGICLLGIWWAQYDYAGAATLFAWRCELLAAGLSLFTMYLYRKFRRWGKERRRQVVTRQKRSEACNALLCTPPPLPDSGHFVQPLHEEFAITIEHWDSHTPTRLSEELPEPTQLPDEFIAPDALVLNLEVKKAA